MNSYQVKNPVEFLHSLGASSKDRHHEPSHVAELIRRSGNFYWVCLYDVTSTEIVAIAWTELRRPPHLRFPRSEGRIGVAVATHREAEFAQVTGFAFDTHNQHTLLTEPAVAILVIRAPVNGKIVGAIEVQAAINRLFTFDEIALLRGLANSSTSVWVKPGTASTLRSENEFVALD